MTPLSDEFCGWGPCRAEICLVIIARRGVAALRLKDLKVTVEGTWLEDCLAELHEELAAADIRVRPHAWISSEWFSPDNTPGIAIPFYLAHPRLMRLERKKILDVEGGTWSECMRILRHEAGHVMQHAYQLHRRRRWQQLFGPSSTRYPRYYRPNPASQNYVQHLRLWYAQSHPDEDFAETFAVWLRPRSNWRTRYAGWPALEKLEYVDELMARDRRRQKPVLTGRERVEPLQPAAPRRSREHYRKKQALYAFDIAEHLRPRPAAAVLRRSAASPARSRPRNSSAATAPRSARLVAKWTGEYQLTLDAVAR